MTNKVSDNLDDLSIPELEALLQSPLTEDDGEPDVAFMIMVTDTILRKEKETNSSVPVDVDKAWSDFQEFYMEETKETQPEAPINKPVRRVRRIIAIAAVVAILSALASIPVMGYKSILHMIGAWTSEQFQFVPADEDSSASNEKAITEDTKKQETIHEALLRYGVEKQVLPATIPEGFEQVEFEITKKDSGDILFHARYQKGDDIIVQNAKIRTRTSTAVYEKNDRPVEMLSIAGLTYYVFSNSKNETATAMYDNVEAAIFTNLPRSFLIDWIKTIEG